jgi:hypothetical protein
MLIKVIESFLIIGAVFFIMYQVITPALMGRPLFPMFRKITKVKSELEVAEEEHDVAVVKQQVAKVRSKTAKKEI